MMTEILFHPKYDGEQSLYYPMLTRLKLSSANSDEASSEDSNEISIDITGLSKAEMELQVRVLRPPSYGELPRNCSRAAMWNWHYYKPNDSEPNKYDWCNCVVCTYFQSLLNNRPIKAKEMYYFNWPALDFS